MKYILLTIFLLIITMVISQAVITKNTSNTGEIPYKTLKQFDGFEIREYPELIVASTKLPGNTYKENSRFGFRTIASYIFGGNKNDMKIAMTSPVQMDAGNNPSMQFFMPTDMNINDLPRPNNSNVSISTQSSSTVAVIKFSGWASDETLAKKYTELTELLNNENITFEQGYSYLGYNPPYQLINRLNELTIKINNYEIK